MLQLTKKITPLFYALVFLGLIGLFLIYKACYFEPHDFSNYYFSARFLVDGTFDSSIYFPHHFNLDIAALGHHHIYTSYAPHNPFLALFFTPLTLFSITTAKLLFNCLSLALFLFSLRNLLRQYPIKSTYLFVLPLLFFIPFKNNFLFGQAYLLLFFLLTEGFLAYKKERYTRMAIFWGIAILLKVIPIVLVGLLFFKKSYKAIGLLAVVGVLLIGVSVLISGVDVWLFYITDVLPKSGNGELTTEFVQNYQSMFMLIKGFFMENSRAFGGFLLLFKLLLIGLGISISIREKSIYKIFSYWIIASILLTPTGSTYSLILLIFPIVFLLNRSEKAKKPSLKTIFALVIVLLISNLPIPSFVNLPLPFSFPRLLLFVLFFFLFTLEDWKVFHWKFASALIIPIIGISIFMHKEKKEEGFVLLKDTPLLTYAITAKNHTLNFTYWGLNGEENLNSEIEVVSFDTTSITLKNGQLFNKTTQLTFGTSTKINPVLLNDTTVVFLSDYKRGIGFFAPRSISLKN